ncbi:MAG: ATP-binding protein [Candidatus Omnitrophica bacterium]|nr:ATP-binding protein [Candidatus Omnitrophota bacterium]
MRWFRYLLLKMLRGRLRTRLLITLLSLAVIPVLVLGTVIIHGSSQTVRLSVLQSRRRLIERGAEEIALFVRQYQDMLVSTGALLGSVYPASWKQETMLVELVLNQPVFIRAASFNESSELIASSELGRGIKWDLPEEAGEVNSGRIQVSKVHFLDNHTPFVTMAVPIRKIGRIVGGLVADINLRGVWDIVDSIRVGDTGRAFLVEADSVVIAHPDKKQVLSRASAGGRQDVRLALSGQSGAVERTDEAGSAWVSAYAPVDGAGWGLVLEQKQEEAYRMAHVMRMHAWGFIALGILGAVGVSFLMTRLLIHPVESLAVRLRRLSSGGETGIRSSDYTEIGQVIKAVNDLGRRLRSAKEKEKYSDVGEAAGMIAHELKNCLVAMKMFVQLFPKKHMDKEFVESFNRLLPPEIARWERMIKELSDYSSFEELRKQDTDLHGLLHDTLGILQDFFREHMVRVLYKPCFACPEINVDPERLKQVFTNLIINAVNAMPEGGGLTITTGIVSSIAAEEGASVVEVRFHDTGPEIDKEEADRIFKPFYTTRKEGKGLGLSISKRIIEQHEGKLWVESCPGEGTTFIIRLPIKKGLGEVEIDQKRGNRRVEGGMGPFTD